MMGKATAAFAALALAAVALTLVARDDATKPPAAALPKSMIAPSVAADAEAERSLPATVQDLDALPEDEGRPALCAGCLHERAVLDVVETYLRHLDPAAYLQGEIWAQPLADVVGKSNRRLPELPEGLLEAPHSNPFGMKVFPARYPAETTWLVWIQTGWIPHAHIAARIRTVTKTTIGDIRANDPVEFAALQAALEEKLPAGVVLTDDAVIESVHGDLPDVALSWPPIKTEVYVAVDSRTGEIWPDGIFTMPTEGWDPFPAHYEAVLDATRARVARWLRGGGSELGSP